MTRFTSRLAVMALAALAPLSAVAAQGLTAMQAIHSATIAAADLMQWKDVEGLESGSRV